MKDGTLGTPGENVIQPPEWCVCTADKKICDHGGGPCKSHADCNGGQCDDSNVCVCDGNVYGSFLRVYRFPWCTP